MMSLYINVVVDEVYISHDEDLYLHCDPCPKPPQICQVESIGWKNNSRFLGRCHNERRGERPFSTTLFTTLLGTVVAGLSITFWTKKRSTAWLEKKKISLLGNTNKNSFPLDAIFTAFITFYGLSTEILNCPSGRIFMCLHSFNGTYYYNKCNRIAINLRKKNMVFCINEWMKLCGHSRRFKH